MGWPKGRPRPRLVNPESSQVAVPEPIDEPPQDAPGIPLDWRKGALLNVRQSADGYVVTLYPEEYDHERPERALRFSNPAQTQDFVSDWYSRQSADPRAR